MGEPGIAVGGIAGLRTQSGRTGLRFGPAVADTRGSGPGVGHWCDGLATAMDCAGLVSDLYPDCLGRPGRRTDPWRRNTGGDRQRPARRLDRTAAGRRPVAADPGAYAPVYRQCAVDGAQHGTDRAAARLVAQAGLNRTALFPSPGGTLVPPASPLPDLLSARVPCPCLNFPSPPWAALSACKPPTRTRAWCPASTARPCWSRCRCWRLWPGSTSRPCACNPVPRWTSTFCSASSTGPDDKSNKAPAVW